MPSGNIWPCGAPNGVNCKTPGCKATLYDIHMTGCPQGVPLVPIDGAKPVVTAPEKPLRSIGDIWASGNL